MDKYVDAEMRLARLLGLFVSLTPEQFQYAMKYGIIPSWCRDWRLAGPLIGDHGITINTEDDATVLVYWPNGVQGLGFDYCDHPDRDTAVRFAVVQAVIAKLSTKGD
jgi:hypothetical protein